MRAEYEDLKGAFEEDVKAAEKKNMETMQRLHSSEEQKASREKQIDLLKRDVELLRSELSHRDREAGELRSSSAKALEAERRELRAVNERLSAEFAQKEKAMLAEISVFRDEASSNEIAAEKYRVQADEFGRNIERVKAVLEEERARKTGAVDREEYELRIKELAAREETLRASVEELQKKLRQAGNK